LPVVPENATITFTVGFNQFDSLSEPLSLRDWDLLLKYGYYSIRRISSLGSSGFEERSFPDLFL
jgi:hypothetical protein